MASRHCCRAMDRSGICILHQCYLASSTALTLSQEGFRAVKPEFILSRYFRSRTNDPTLSIAEFSPRHRKGYHFHYAALDGPPTLRRLTLNGSQTYDHIARQAQLVLKSNGVYFVQGAEDKGQLRWKFEYIVDDRRGRNGKVLTGERVSSKCISIQFTKR